MNEPTGKNRQATRTLLLVFAGLVVGTCLYLFVDMNVASSLSPTAADLASSRSANSGDGGVPLVNVKMEPYPRAEGLDFLTLVCGAPSTLQGGNDDDDVVGGDGNNWTDTRWLQGGSAEFNRVQKLIYDSQHPANCSEKKIMQWVGAFEGFTAIGIGGQLSTLSLTLGLAIVRDKVLVVGDNSSQFTNCPQGSFECFLEPLSSCPQEPIHTRLQKRRKGWKTGDITTAHLESIFSRLCERFGIASVVDLHMHLLAYIMRPRRRLCRKMLDVAQESFSLSTPSSWWSPDVSVHLRTGDKHELGDELLSKFVSAMDKMFPTGPFHGHGMFSSDDFGAIEVFKHALGTGLHGAAFEQVNPKFFLKLTGDDGAGTKREKNAALEINHRMRDDPNSVDMLEILLINMFLLANSQRLVAAFDSNWARILVLMMKSTAARQQDLPSKRDAAGVITFQDVNTRLKSDTADSIWIVKGGAWSIANNCLLFNGDADSLGHGSSATVCRMGHNNTTEADDSAKNATTRQFIMDKFPNRGSCFAYQKVGTSQQWRRKYRKRAKEMQSAQKELHKPVGLNKRSPSDTVTPKLVAVQACELWVLDRLLPKVESEHSARSAISEKTLLAALKELSFCIGSDTILAWESAAENISRSMNQAGIIPGHDVGSINPTFWSSDNVSLLLNERMQQLVVPNPNAK